MSGLQMSTTINTQEFVKALDELVVKANKATELAVRRGISYFTARAMEHTPVGKSVKEPRHVGGTLRRSIRIVEVLQMAPGTWYASAGPAVVYGRQRDLGGTIRARNAPYLKFQINGHWVQVKEVTQTGSFFMEKALADTEAAFGEIYRTAWTESMV